MNSVKPVQNVTKKSSPQKTNKQKNVRQFVCSGSMDVAKCDPQCEVETTFDLNMDNILSCRWSDLCGSNYFVTYDFSNVASALLCLITFPVLGSFRDRYCNHCDFISTVFGQWESFTFALKTDKDIAKAGYMYSTLPVNTIMHIML